MNSEINTKFQGFMDMVLYYFDIAITLKSLNVRETITKEWIAQGLKLSSK